MHYSLDQLETFASVAETGSFSAAARRLGRTQSTVSVAIANLEADLGVALFDRTPRVPTLTEAGRSLLRPGIFNPPAARIRRPDENPRPYP